MRKDGNTLREEGGRPLSSPLVSQWRKIMEEKVVIDMRLSTKDIWKFSLYHASRGFQGVFNVLITVVSLGYLIFRWNMLAVNHRVILLLLGLLFSVIQPAILYIKAASQARSEAIEQGMHLEFSNEGIDARQGDQEIHYTWDNVYKSMIKRDLLIIYFDHVRAYLVPKRYWQKDREKLLTIIRANTRVRNF